MIRTRYSITLATAFLLSNVVQAQNPCISTNGLSTAYAAGNNHDGVMFDINVLQDLTVECFEINWTTSGTLFQAEIWTKVGTHVGAEMDSTMWTKVGTVDSLMSAGLGNPTYIPISVGLMLSSGSTQAFYLTNTGGSAPSVSYTDGVAVGTVLASDVSTEILEGAGLAYPFGAGSAPFTPRNYNGTMYYTSGTTGVNGAMAIEAPLVQPNPTNGNFTITIPEQLTGKITVTDIAGKILVQVPVNTQRTVDMDLSGYVSGVYFVTLHSASGVITEKLIKQ